MAFDRLRQRINAQAKEMRNGDYIRDMVDKAAVIVRDNAPNDSGMLVRNITTQTPLRETASGFTKGLGDRAVVGKENSSPRGTIKAFLRDFPEFRNGGDGEKDKEKKPKGTVSISIRRGAWQGLSKEGKEKLQEERLAGNYGGLTSISSGKTPYFFAQEGSFGWATSAGKAGITPTYFVKKSLDQWRSTVLPSIIAKFKARFNAA